MLNLLTRCRSLLFTNFERRFSQQFNPPDTQGYSRPEWHQLCHRISALKQIQTHETVGRPIAVIMPWVNAHRHQTDRYVTIYSDQGYRVLLVQMTALDLLPPKYGSQATARRLVRFLLDEKLAARTDYGHIVFHCLSAGCYMFAELVAQLQHLDTRRHLLDCFRGVIFDSTMTYDHTLEALPRGITDNTVLQSIIRNAAKLGFALTGAEAALMHAQHCLTSVPLPMRAAAFIWSENDPVASEANFRHIGDVFHDRNVRMFYQKWEVSKHCNHLLCHPNDYFSIMQQYMEHLGILQQRHLLSLARLRLNQ